MLSLFQRKRPPVAAAPSPAPATDLPKGLMRPESAASLLATPRRQKLLEHIWQRTSLSRQQFTALYLAPLERYAELCALTLARAHAKSGDAATISGYLGKSEVFDEAVGDFALLYADQTERDHAQLLKAARSGRVNVLHEE